MSSQPPKIDQRTYDDLVRQTAEIVSATEIEVNGEYKKWLPPADQQKPDPGWALIRIFARMATLVSDRLNQVPEKNFLAFLDLLGGQLYPPQPARVPLTFYLSEGSTSEAVVPPHTQISAPASQDNAEEVVFETDRELVVTTAQLQAVFVRQPDQDKYQDCTDAAIGKTDEAFLVFEGVTPIDHYLYIACEEIFSLGDLKNVNMENVKLTFKTATDDDAALYRRDLQISWSYWDGSKWTDLQPTETANATNWVVTFSQLPRLFPHAINGSKQRWLRVRLSNVLTASPAIQSIEVSVTVKSQQDFAPDSCLFNSTPLDLSKDFYPFGEQPGFNDTFYIASQAALGQAGNAVTLKIGLNSQKQAENGAIELVWEGWDGSTWQTMKLTEDKSKSFLSSGEITFSVPDWLKPTDLGSGELNYWIRVRILSKIYGTPAVTKHNVLFSGVTKITSNATNASEIQVENASVFSSGDKVWICSQIPTQEKPPDTQVGIVQSVSYKELTLISPTNVTQETWVIRNPYVVPEQPPAVYKPPVVQSLTFSFTATVTASSIATSSTPALVSCKTYNDFFYHTLAETGSFTPFTPTKDGEPTLYLGFSQPEGLDRQGIPPFNNKPVTLYAEVDPPSAEDSSAIANNPETVQIVWEYSSPTGWSRLPGVRDETQVFFQRGLIQFIGPSDLSKQSQFGQNLYWLRVRWTGGNFLVKPRLRQLLTNTTWAVQAVTLRQEVLGSSNGDRDQVFLTSQAPVLEGQQLEVQEGDLLTPEEQQFIRQHLGADALTVMQDETGKVEAHWVRWREVPDFYSSQARDRHYVLDRQTGSVQFGDGQSGRIPPRGTNNIRMAAYRTGGGVGGNKAAQTITQLKTTIPYVDRAINFEAAGGGAEQEDLDHLKERVPKWLRHRDRAVAKQDFEDLAYAASPEVARVQVITTDAKMQQFDPLLSENWLDPKTGQPDPKAVERKVPDKPEQIKVIIVPKSRDFQPIPSLALLKQVETYLCDRCEPGVDLVVTGPRWKKVTVTTTIVPISFEQADVVRSAVVQRLAAFLHPLSGGQGNGWVFGRYPHKSDLYALIQSVQGVDYVQSLTSDPGFDASGKEIQLDADCFIYSGSHTVTVTGGGV